MLCSVTSDWIFFLTYKKFSSPESLFPSLFRHLKPTLRLVKSYTQRIRLIQLIPVLHVSKDRLGISQGEGSHCK